ncbi:MAG: triose-phosphate isomerase, partial [Myxococcales bacterium]|nr:triose-phosphate isomerase [Myxococcales bacterium]
EVVVVPPFPFLAALSKKLVDSPIALGAQNCHEAASGAFTGEVSVAALQSVGCRWVVIGHSERRQLFGEGDERIAAKMFAALQGGLNAILCVGETLDQREGGATLSVVQEQLTAGLSKVTREEMAKVVIAYEPVWAIGTGRTATPQQAQDVHAAIRRLLEQLYGPDVATATRIQYGGSVKPQNAAELMDQTDVDGALVGGASLEPRSFAEIVQFYRTSK